MFPADENFDRLEQTAASQTGSTGPILVGSAPSCGSTLFSTMLDAHPQVVCGPELNLVSHPVFWAAQGEDWHGSIHRWLARPVAPPRHPSAGPTSKAVFRLTLGSIQRICNGTSGRTRRYLIWWINTPTVGRAWMRFSGR